jgi:hypothetical protein
MTMTGQRARWGTARVLFGGYLLFVLMAAGVAMVLTAIVTAAIAVLGTLSTSLVDPAATVLRWFALGYGIYLFSTALPTHIAHGQTRRNFMVQAALFVVAASIAVGAVLTAMYALEGAVFGRLGWDHVVADDRLYAGPGDWGLVLLTYSALLAVWAMVGGFLSAAFYRTGGWGPLLVLPAIALVVLVGSAVGVSGLPFIGRLLDLGTGSLPGALAGVVAAVLVSAGLTWAVVRDLPVRRRTQ